MAISTIILLPLLGALLNGVYALRVSMTRRTPNESIVSLVGVGLPLASFVIALVLGWPLLHGSLLQSLAPPPHRTLRAMRRPG